MLSYCFLSHFYLFEITPHSLVFCSKTFSTNILSFKFFSLRRFSRGTVFQRVASIWMDSSKLVRNTLLYPTRQYFLFVVAVVIINFSAKRNFLKPSGAILNSFSKDIYQIHYHSREKMCECMSRMK